MQNYDLSPTMASAEKYDTKPIGDVMVSAIDRLSRLKYRPTRPSYPKELSHILVKAGFDRSRIRKVDEDFCSSYARFAIDDKENPSTTEGGYIWIDIPVEWLETEVEKFLKENEMWLQYIESEEELIGDWLGWRLYEYERKQIINKVFDRLITDIFQSIEVLPA